MVEGSYVKASRILLHVKKYILQQLINISVNLLQTADADPERVLTFVLQAQTVRSVKGFGLKEKIIFLF